MKQSVLIRAAGLASPLIWFTSHAIQFALAPLTCTWHSNAILWMVTGIALTLDLLSGFTAWLEWHREPDRWLAMSGMVLSGGFFLVIVAQALPVLILAGCE